MSHIPDISSGYKYENDMDITSHPETWKYILYKIALIYLFFQ